MTSGTIRVAAVGDLHCTKGSQGFLQPLCARVAETADMLLLAGDLTNAGLPEEARVLARELAGMRVPTVAVLGNHDFESDKSDEVVRILTEGGTPCSMARPTK
jgi:predicted MPP superfamily phosphohydrolase